MRGGSAPSLGTRGRVPCACRYRWLESRVAWIARNARQRLVLAGDAGPLLGCRLDTEDDMNPHATLISPIAARDAGGAGMAWLDSGITPGMVVVDANRPASGAPRQPAAIAGHAVGLLKQSRAAN